MKIIKWLMLAATLALAPSLVNAQAVLNERTLSYNAALEMATAALESCRKGGYRVAVTVLNRAGRTKVVIHDDGAGPHTLENSLRKAYTSLTYRVPSGEFGKRMASTPPPHSAMVLDKVTAAEGALPVMSNKEVIGSIGISGAPGGHLDAACAQVGIDKIAAGLN
ncbi:MAG TPA: heme-binding protein [Burkholderiales bacterium]|nr:heme-binding protein [Burkholderiales bacterium]